MKAQVLAVVFFFFAFKAISGINMKTEGRQIPNANSNPPSPGTVFLRVFPSPSPSFCWWPFLSPSLFSLSLCLPLLHPVSVLYSKQDFRKLKNCSRKEITCGSFAPDYDNLALWELSVGQPDCNST